MSRESLGEFEQFVLLAILRLIAAGTDEIYGVLSSRRSSNGRGGR
jgi:hypothetical protein